MNEPFEARLKEHLSSIDRVPVENAAAVESAAGRAVRRIRRRRGAGVALASVVLIAAGVVVVRSNRSHSPGVVSPATEGATSSQDIAVDATEPTAATEQSEASSGSAPAVPTTQPAAPTTWSPIAPDPRGAASHPSLVWTGDEALVVGGLDPSGEPNVGAAAYDPTTDSWRKLANPLSGDRRVDPLVAWTGKEMLIIGGNNSDGSPLVSAGEAYEPSTDTWRATPTPPVGFVSDRSPAVWTGTELLVWPSDGGDPSTVIAPLAYDPQLDTWRQLSKPPVGRRQQAASVWTGAEWIVWGGTTGDAELADGVAYDPSSDTWRLIAESPLSARRVRAVWTGSEMIVDAGSTGGDRRTGNGELALADGAAYDPATDSWREITAGLAHPGFIPVWTGRQVVMFAKGGAIVYDVAADQWVETSRSESGGGDWAEPVWTGSVVLLIGSGVETVGGTIFTPPESPPALTPSKVDATPSTVDATRCGSCPTIPPPSMSSTATMSNNGPRANRRSAPDLPPPAGTLGACSEPLPKSMCSRTARTSAIHSRWSSTATD